jgi:hypothetical protein
VRQTLSLQQCGTDACLPRCLGCSPAQGNADGFNVENLKLLGHPLEFECLPAVVRAETQKNRNAQVSALLWLGDPVGRIARQTHVGHVTLSLFEAALRAGTIAENAEQVLFIRQSFCVTEARAESPSRALGSSVAALSREVEKME